MAEADNPFLAAPMAARPAAAAPSDNPFLAAPARATEAYNPDEYEGVMQEFFEGVASGATKIPQGVLETLALAPDYLAGTDYGRDVTEGFEGFRASLGIDPRGLSGAIGEVGTQFVLPGVAAARAVGAISKAGRAGTFLRQLGAAGFTDAVVSTNGTMTLGDFFEGGPTQTTEDIGLQGQEEAVRRAFNKLSVGVEGTLGVVAAPFIARGITGAAGAAATAAGQIPGATQAARLVQRGTRAVGRELGRIEESLRMGEDVGPLKTALGQGLATLRYRGFLPEPVAEARSLVAGITEAELSRATKRAAAIDKMIPKVLADFNKTTAGTTPLTRKDLLNTIEQYLTLKDRRQAAQLFKSLPNALKPEVRSMRRQIDALSRDILNSDYMSRFGGTVQNAAGQTLQDIIRGNIGSYVRRRYRVFEDADYTPDAQTLDYAVQGFMRDRKATESLFRDLISSQKMRVSDLGNNVMPDGTVQGAISRQQAEIAAREFLARYKRRDSAKALGRIAENRLSTNMFIERTNLRDYQKALLGEVHNPLENYVATVADMAEFKAVDDYFRKIKDLAQNNPRTFGRIFRDTSTMTPPQMKLLTDEGYRILGEGDDPLKAVWGSLTGYAVPDRVWKDLTRTVTGDLGVAGNAARSLYSTFLQGKGGVQYAATVLSPTTQIRNVSTASLFALMQGNVGRGANLFESMRLVFENLSPTKMTDEFAKLQRLGVVGTQVELREIQDMVSKGFGYAQPVTVQGVPVGRRIGSSFTDNPIGAFVRGAGKRAENLYQAGDDLWKIYNFQFERSKLLGALGKMDPQAQAQYIANKAGRPMSLDEFADDEAARIVRNLVPNYNLVPESVRFIRKLPVGNFIAFPYEIMRTGINTIARGIDELADANVEIQKIGLRRLLGASSALTGVSPGLTAMAYQLSGVSEDEMKAYQRALAPPWERNATLIPVGRQEDGTPKYINWSTSNPYEILERTVTAAINKTEEGQRLGKPTGQIVFDAFSESISEVLSPFFDEAIMTAKLRDVLDPETRVPGVRQLAQFAGGRAGETITGAKVYNPEDSPGDKAAKSFAHIVDGILPPLIPVELRGANIEPSPLARGFVNSLNLNEELGFSEKDRSGIERELTTELTRALTGVAESTNTATLGVAFKGYEFSDARRQAANIFNNVARRQNVQSDDLIRAYIDANEAAFRVQNDFYQKLQDIQSFGFPRNKMLKILKDAKVGRVEDIARGRFQPFEISDDVLDAMRRNGTLNQLPRSEIRRILVDFRGRRLGEAVQPQATAPAPSAPAPAPSAQAPAANPFMDLPAAQAPAVNPFMAVPAAPTAPAAPRPSALLGSNPVSAARNAEIQARQSP